MGSVKGSTEISLPEQFSELYIIVPGKNASSERYAFYIPKICLDDNFKPLVEGFGIVSDQQYCEEVKIAVSLTNVKLLISCKTIGSSYTNNKSTTTIYVYYR